MLQEKVDKIFTWTSETLLPKWCQSEEHWTSKLTAFLWVDCPCCLMFRGITIGLMLGLAIGCGFGYLLS